ncbi:hypothetical protein NEH16_23015 [Streptomyces drozdowiczii]|uniref:Uncharacterized protein n=1 Tax=Streptomyces drozdowiczii TaxID=202862 RepID=A0ABY6PXM8_9ACTN|nr:hypothetical protein [Streptomyces drozdowiczii]UZK56571.1 hypothetical protein NEH16_23015 [Streptomyces drozdowiczii]
MLKPSRRPLLHVAVATAALTVALSAPAPAFAWDAAGHAWAAEAAPYSDTTLLDVADMGRGRTWAAGFTIRTEGKVTRFRPVVAERAAPGAAWTPVPSATAAAGEVSSRVNAMDVNGGCDVWLVGDDSAALDGKVYTQHFDGERWQVVPVELPEKSDAGSLLDVDARPGGAWAAGIAQIEVSRTWNEAKGAGTSSTGTPGSSATSTGRPGATCPSPNCPATTGT